MRLLLALALWTSSALADPADALAPYPRSLYLQARVEEGEEDWSEAAELYRKVRMLDPAFTQASLGLARVLQADGDVEGAEAAYRALPYDSDAVRALGQLYLEEERWDAALDAFERLWPLSGHEPETLRLQVTALAHVDATEAETRFREYLEYDLVVDPADEEVADTARQVAELLEESGEDDAALTLLEDLATRAGDEAATEIYAPILDRLRVRRDARTLAATGAQPLTAVQRESIERARRFAAEGEPGRAEALLRGVVDAAPRSPEARAALADVLEDQGDIAGAEVEAFLATRLDPLDPEHLIRYGDLLAEYHGGRLDDQAAGAYQKALARQASSPEIWYRKGRVERRSGQLDQARASWSTCLRLDPDGPHTGEIHVFLEDIARDLPDMPELPPTPAPRGIPDDARLDFHVALVYQQPGRRPPVEDPESDEETDLERALFHVRRAQEQAPEFVAAHNLEAQILLEMGREAEATERWRRSLELDPEQPGVMVVLAEVERRRGHGEAADQLLQEAAALGAADALYYQARASVNRGSWLDARHALARYDASGGSPLTQDRAHQLQEHVESRILAMQLGAAGLGGGVLVLPLAYVGWRRSGATVETLLARAPASWRDVARIASAIRHEVLKHNITALDAVAMALEDRDPEPARWLAEKLYGPRGAISRFDEYVDELKAVGQRFGVRLNLRVRDPIFAPLHDGMQRLRRLRRSLETGSGRSLASSLREISLTLNQEGFAALGELVQRVCVLSVDRALLMDVWAEVRREPAFREAGVVDFHVDLPDDQSLEIRIWRSDLEDILANLLRNALSASLEAGTSRIGVRVETEADWITGLDEVVVAVVDDAPRRITTAMIRGRYIERGLGLAVDLISRNGGSIRVEDAEGWSKAVAVRLPRAEAG